MVIFSVNAVPENIFISVWFQKIGYGINWWKLAYLCCSPHWELKLADNLVKQLCKLLQCDVVYTCTLFLSVVFWPVRAFLKSSILKIHSHLSPSLESDLLFVVNLYIFAYQPFIGTQVQCAALSHFVSNCWLKIKSNLRFSVTMFCSLEQKNIFLPERKILQQLISHLQFRHQV